MRKVRFLWICSLLLSGVSAVAAQKDETGKTPKQDKEMVQAEREVRDFYDAYAEDLRAGRRESIADRYDERGYYRMGAGGKQLVSFEETKKVYMTRWSPPKSFAWSDLSFDILGKDSAVVTGLFDWETAEGVTLTLSYTGVLTKRAGKWRIRVEDENGSPNLIKTEPVLGNSSTAGAFKFILKAQPTAIQPPHRHSVELRGTVKSGRLFILLGDLSNAKLQVIEAGSSLTIPANMWHVEWWETETVIEIEGTGPMRTERASPLTPRTP